MPRYIDADKLTVEDIRNLDLLPGEDVAPVVHGKWIKNEVTPSIHFFKCSHCGETRWRTYNFCPACGAKMDEKGEENETE